MGTVKWTWETYLDLGDLGEHAAEIRGTINYNGESVECSSIEAIKIVVSGYLRSVEPKLLRYPQKLHTDFEEAYETYLLEPPDEDTGRDR